LPVLESDLSRKVFLGKTRLFPSQTDSASDQAVEIVEKPSEADKKMN
jgi:hypothetical protein